MKNIISIAFAAVLAGFIISCQKENVLPELEAAPVQYTFNISVNEQFGFDSGASTKGGSSATYKTTWTSGDRIFLFFKPASGNLLEDTYATLLYNGSSWEGSVSGTSSLGEGGTLSAVYVYNLGCDVTPEFSGWQWIIATADNVFYNCQAGLSYTVSGGEITASLNLEAPADFVQFYVKGGASGPLTCDKVKGWKDVAIGSEMDISNITSTGYMNGFANSGDPNVMEYYGRLVRGTSLKDVDCKFTVVKNGKVYEHSATPGTTARGFSMNTTSWTEASGILPGLFSIEQGSLVRFSQGNLYYDESEYIDESEQRIVTVGFCFETNQYDYQVTRTPKHVSYFYWCTDPEDAAKGYDTTGSTSSGDVIFSNDTESTPKRKFTVNGVTGQFRTLSKDEWSYLFNNHSYKWVTVNGVKGYAIAPDGFDGTIADTYADNAALATDNLLFLPAAGGEIEENGFYWSSSSKSEEEAYGVWFHGSGVTTNFPEKRSSGYCVRLVKDC